MSDDESATIATGLTSVLAFGMAKDAGGFIRRPSWTGWLHYDKPDSAWPSGWAWSRGVKVEGPAGFSPDDILATDWEWRDTPP